MRDFREYREQDVVQAIFERARKLAPCILAFEDIDGLVGAWNRTVFLNELDGFQRNEGLLIIASSNHPGQIDQALLKRPSRFDRVFHLGLPGLSERQEFCRRMLARLALQGRLSPAVAPDSLAGRVAAGSGGFTPAYLKEVFVSAALRQAQGGATILDGEFAAAALAQVDELRNYLRAVRNPDALAEVDHRSLSSIGFQPGPHDRGTGAPRYYRPRADLWVASPLPISDDGEGGGRGVGKVSPGVYHTCRCPRLAGRRDGTRWVSYVDSLYFRRFDPRLRLVQRVRRASGPVARAQR